MLIKITKMSDVPPSEITPAHIWHARRQFLKNSAAWVGGASSASALGALAIPTGAHGAYVREKLPNVTQWPHSISDDPTPYEAVTGYNNFYEFGTDKSDPAQNAQDFITRPWTITVDGEVARPGVYDVDDLIRPHQLEERVYRHRCVEAWSMVVPWVGVPLGDILRKLEPTGNAKYVAFETLHDPERMPGQKRQVLQWPYTEGLRLDEAMHPLTMLAVGVYGEVMPPQNGAPIRLVVPWKYGFKGIKSIVRITLSEKEPPTSWNISQPREYGFYANVNPTVDHPRWSQASERPIGQFSRRPTLMFNGYADEVASLYAGFDLEKYF